MVAPLQSNVNELLKMALVVFAHQLAVCFPLGFVYGYSTLFHYKELLAMARNTCFFVQSDSGGASSMVTESAGTTGPVTSRVVLDLMRAMLPVA